VSKIAPGFYQFNDFINLPFDEDPWLIKPLIPAGGWVSLYGEPKKARKSYLAIGMSWAVSSGQSDWLGFGVEKSGPVLYLQVDTPHTMWRQRNLDIHTGGYDLSNIWFASLMTMPYPFNIAQHEDILGEMIADVPEPPVMIVFDTGRRLHQMDENSSQDMTMFMAALENVSGLSMAKILITHGKKGPSEGDPDKDDGSHEAEGGDLMKGNRGSSAVVGAVDTIIKMTPKGWMYYQGRQCGEMHKKLKFTHVYGEAGYMWEEDIPAEVLEAQRLIRQYKNGSERSLGRMLAKSQGWEDGEEKARALIRRQKEKR
jgi:hypothetical protein